MTEEYTSTFADQATEDLLQAIGNAINDKPLEMVVKVFGVLIGDIADCDKCQSVVMAVIDTAMRAHDIMYHSDDIALNGTVH